MSSENIVFGPIKCASRVCEDGFIRAYLMPSAKDHPDEQSPCVAALLKSVATKHPHSWELFKEMMAEIGKAATEDITGFEVKKNIFRSAPDPRTDN